MKKRNQKPNMNNLLNILVADDHVMIRNGIHSMLNDQTEITVRIDEAENGAQVLDTISRMNYDILILDVKVPRTNGLTVIKVLKSRKCCTPVIALCSKDEKEFIRQAIRGGVRGVILKSSGTEELVKAIKTVSDGGIYYSNEIAQMMLSSKNTRKSTQKLESVTRREWQILEMLSNEYSTTEIAVKLGISKRTVEGHRNNLKEKLNAKTTIGLVKYAIESGCFEKM